jgi:hypothetical protein
MEWVAGMKMELTSEELVAFGENVRGVLPGAEFEDQNGDFVLTIVITENENGGYTVTYNGNE